MKQKMDKLKNKLNENNKLIIFLISLTIIGIITGTIFSIIINDQDKILVSDYLNNFLITIRENKINSLNTLKNILLDNGFSLITIWLIGISIIGIPIILIIFFSKSFIIGFTIGSLIINYKIKGCLLSIIYIFPHQIINILMYMLLIMYSLAFSIRLLYAIIRKKTIDFKPIMNKYLRILIISVMILLITTIYETFIMPKIILLIIPLI